MCGLSPKHHTEIARLFINSFCTSGIRVIKIETCWYDFPAVKNIGDILLTIVVLGGILVLSGIFTSVFTRKMYYRCAECKELNAKRRTHCRICGNELPNPNRDKL